MLFIQTPMKIKTNQWNQSLYPKIN